MKKLKISFFIIVLFISMAGIAAMLGTNNWKINLDNKLQLPNTQNWLGTDQNGIDVMKALFYGSQYSIGISLSVVIVTLCIGLILGSLAGFFSGWIDYLIMRLVDLVLGLPSFLIILSVVAILQESTIFNLIIALSITSWAGYVRLVRGEILHLKSQEYIISARALGLPPQRILFLHIWPNLFAPLITQASFHMAAVIIIESSLSFLGLGPSPQTPTWGSLLGAGRQYLIEAPHLSLFPALCILSVVLAFNLFGDALRDYLDPRSI